MSSELIFSVRLRRLLYWAFIVKLVSHVADIVTSGLWLLFEVGIVTTSWFGPTGGGSSFFADLSSDVQTACELTDLRSPEEQMSPCGEAY